MNGRIEGTKAALCTLSLLIGSCVVLAGCGGGGGSDAEAAPATSSGEPGTNPVPAPAPVPQPQPDPEPPVPEPEPGPRQPEPPAPEPEPGPTPPPPGNGAPTIAGAAQSAATVDLLYSFSPSASDPDGDQLTFQISNKPAWATFDTLTGRLSGTPGAASLGTYSDIRISTSDGQALASLSAFAITVVPNAEGGVTLLWTAPTQNMDGSALTDLSGYTIHYGPSSSNLYHSVGIDNPSVNAYVFDQLTPGTHYFAIKAHTASGADSDVSNVVSQLVQ